MELFQATLGQMGFLFLLIALGFIVVKCKVLDSDSAQVLSKLENTIFVPALVLNTFIDNFTVEKISSAGLMFGASFVLALIMIPIAILVSKFCSKDKYIQKIYTYGLAFSNFGFMGNAVVNALFPDIFMNYLIFTLPLWTLIYIWGVPKLLIANEQKTSFIDKLKPFANPMLAAMLVGMILGLSGVGSMIPSWLKGAVESASDCMSPVAMLLTGITIAGTDLKKVLKIGSIYVVSVVRLIIFPAIFMIIIYFFNLPQDLVICAVCSLAMPLGLSTIVVPRAYGRDTSVAAGMAVVSHLLSCITIPIVFYFMTQFLIK